METITQAKKTSLNWRHFFLSYSFLLLAVLCLVASVFLTKLSAQRSSFSPEFPAVLLQKVNQARQAEGREILQENQQLQIAAQKKLLDMAQQEYWAHQAPDGRQASDFAKEENYLFNELGENLARDLLDPTAIVSAWLNSESHRRNLLAEDFSQTGIAAGKISLLGRPTFVVVEIFAEPAARNLDLTRSNSSQVLPAAGRGAEKVPSQKVNLFFSFFTPEKMPWFCLVGGGIFFGIFFYQRWRFSVETKKVSSEKERTSADL